MHPLAIRTFKLEKETETKIGNERKGRGGIHCDRGEKGKYMLTEIVLQPLPLSHSQLLRRQHGDALFFQFFPQLPPAGLLFLHEGGRPGQDGGNLLLRTEAIDTRGGNPRLDLPLKAGHPHHIEFVPVRGGYGEKTNPFKQGMAVIAGLLQHPFIKGQPAQLSIEKPLW